jgi:dipeptidyl aminopeptidase/acylaminoacyl peptidase
MTGISLRFTVFVCLAAFAFADGKRPIAETDLYAFRWAADPRMSPGGSQVAFTYVTVNAKHDNYETALWIVSTQGGDARQITSGPHDSSPRWSPDGRRIAFTRALEKDGRILPAQIFILSMDGGEARQLTDVPKGASEPVWSPDGKTIAFTSTANAQDLEKKDGKQPEPSDVRVIVRAAYRANGSGYIDFTRPAHIWTAPVPAEIDAPQKSTQITSGPFSEADVIWSRDSARLYFVSNRDREPYYRPPVNEVFSVGAQGGTPQRVTGIEGRLGSMALSPDGTRLAFLGSLNGDPIRSYSQPDLFVADLAAGGAPKNLTAAYDFDIGGGVGGDQRPPRGDGHSRPFWSADGQAIFVVSAEEGAVNLKRVNASSGKVEAVTTGAHDFYSLTADARASRAAAAVSTPTRIGDVYLLDLASGALRQLTDINRDLFSQLNLTEPEMIWYKSFDGRRIQAWVQKPPDFDASKKYPLILDIHGGPHAAYGYTFDHEFQWMAAKGYLVLYPNPRGSTTYGQEFGNIIQFRYPGDDYRDLIAGVDELVRRGWVDPERLGVTGGSGGGVLTNWTIGHTNRFKAAVSQRSIADWRDFWYTADFTLFEPTWFRGAPWNEEADFKARSPITYVEKITTPLMLIEGGSDLRTPPGAGGEQMFRALKFLKKPVVMVQFPGESHELSRSGKPVHRVERLQHIVAWFDKYLLGKDIRTYDIE